jgi:hypothetical protein
MVYLEITTTFGKESFFWKNTEENRIEQEKMKTLLNIEIHVCQGGTL